MTPETLSAVLDHLAYPVFVKDSAFTYVLANRAMCALMGVSPDAILQHTDDDFLSPAEAAVFRRTDNTVLASPGVSHVFEESVTDAHGASHTLSTTKFALRSLDGASTHIVGIIHEITAIREAAEVLQRANEFLEERVRDRTEALELAQRELVRRERLAILGHFAGGIAHQIRNPLGAIKNAAYLINLALRPSPSEDIIRALQIIRDEVTRANKIITDLVEYTQVSPPRRRSTPVSELVSDALSDIDLRSVAVDVAVASSLPELDVDPTQVQRALNHLMSNALQAMHNGGRLGLRATLADDSVVIAVSDTGPGIPPEIRLKLFEPLVSTQPGSFGLGLMTAKALIEANSGTLEVSSSNEHGTTFSLSLPISPVRR